MSNLPNGYFLADTNSLVYAYRAGGTPLLDTYFNFARQQGREFAITETVAREIRVGPLNQELGRYITEKGIKVLDAPEVEHQLKAGQIPRKDAGERSMLEIATSEHASGRTTPIWSDDKFFENRQMMRGAQAPSPSLNEGVHARLQALDANHAQQWHRSPSSMKSRPSSAARYRARRVSTPGTPTKEKRHAHQPSIASQDRRAVP